MGDEAGQRERNLELVRQVFAHISAGEHERMVELMADDLVFELPYGPKGMPGRFESKRKFQRLQAGMFPLFSRFALELVEVHPTLDPSMLVAEYRSDAQVKKNGAPYQNRYIGVFRFREGKICFWREFHNPEAASAALA